MNRIIFYPLLIVSCLSCTTKQQESAIQDSGGHSPKIAIEICSSYRVSSYDRLLEPETDQDFINTDIAKAMENSTRYIVSFSPATKVRAPKATTGTALDSEEIPFIADVSERTEIYDTGIAYYEKEIDLDYEENPLLGFHTTPLDLSHCVSKITINGGKATTYNKDGVQLSQMDVDMPDYTEYLAELQRLKNEAETKSPTRKDINWLKTKMEASTLSTKAGNPTSYDIFEKPSGVIVLQQNYMPTKGGSAVTVRTFYSADLSKNLGFEQEVGGALTVRCTNTFSNSSAITKSFYSTDGIAEELPSNTMIESISTLPDGTPSIKVENKEYFTNKVIVDL